MEVYVGRDRGERDNFTVELVEMLKMDLALALTCSNDNHSLCRNQVNVSVFVLSLVLHALKARICRISFYEMKWRIYEAEPVIDFFIEKYRAEMGVSVLVQNNLIDYELKFHTDDLVFNSFSDDQRRATKFKDGSVHLMCNNEMYGSLDFRPIIDQRTMWVKVYQKLCHEVFSMIQRQMLDHMPTSMRIMHTPLRQF